MKEVSERVTSAAVGCLLALSAFAALLVGVAIIAVLFRLICWGFGL